MYVKHDGRVFPCCQSYMLDGEAVGDLRVPSRWIQSSTRHPCRNCANCTPRGRSAEIDMCARCCTVIPHPALVAGSLLLHGKWVRRAMPIVERLVYGRKLPKALLAPAREELVQITRK